MRTLITGASAGIGRALALELARRGHELALLARRRELLDQLAADIAARGGRAVGVECDASDRVSTKQAVSRATELLGGDFDLVIANAGVSVPTNAQNFRADDAEQTLKLNLLGTVYLFEAVIPAMVARGSGRFVGVASLAGLRGLPGAAPYSASKAGMQAFLEAVRVELAPVGVGVTIVNPGFVATPMTEKNRFRMPFLMSADEAAIRIADGIESGRRVIEFPLPMSILMRCVRLLPAAVYDRVMLPYGRRKIDRGRVKR